MKIWFKKHFFNLTYKHQHFRNLLKQNLYEVMNVRLAKTK